VFGQAAHHQADHHFVDQVLCGSHQRFIVFGHTSGLPELGKGSLHHPAALQHDKTLGHLHDPWRCLFRCPGPDQGCLTISSAQPKCVLMSPASFPVYPASAHRYCMRGKTFGRSRRRTAPARRKDIRLMHLDRHHQTQRINKQMTLSSTDLLPTVITARAASFSGFHRLTVNDPGTGCRLAAFSLTQQFT